VAAVHEAFMHGWAVAMATAAVMLAAAAIVNLRTPRSAGSDLPAAVKYDASIGASEALGDA
jgi:hypothetical protein